MPVTDLIPRRSKDPIQRQEQAVPLRDEHPWSVFQRRVNRLFDEFARGLDLGPFGQDWTAFSPRVDVVETENEIVVSAELPGLSDKDIDISLSHDVLTISGEKKQEKEERSGSYCRTERSYGAFRRSISLPTEVDAGKTDAVFRRGVLTVTLPKTGEAQSAKKIAVKTQ